VPKLGTVRRAKDVGLGSGYHKCVWHACENCKAKRWVLLRRGEPQSRLCYPCGRVQSGQLRAANPLRGKDHPRWKGGRSETKGGYVEVWMDPADPLFVMAGKDGYVYEHRLVVARHLCRALETDEEVHHQNRDKHDNRVENLVLLSRREHAFGHYQSRDLLLRIEQLERENDELRRRLAAREAPAP
jgi:hypothetical protein